MKSIINKKIKIFIAFDIGLKNIGVAIGNNIVKQARPLKIIKRSKKKIELLKIKSLIIEWNPLLFVIGVPYSNNKNDKHGMLNHCLNFSKELNKKFGLNIKIVDESYSSIIIKRKNKELIDSKSASIILQQYFNSTKEL